MAAFFIRHVCWHWLWVGSPEPPTSRPEAKVGCWLWFSLCPDSHCFLTLGALKWAGVIVTGLAASPLSCAGLLYMYQSPPRAPRSVRWERTQDGVQQCSS